MSRRTFSVCDDNAGLAEPFRGPTCDIVSVAGYDKYMSFDVLVM
jgi:hypothetical protein